MLNNYEVYTYFTTTTINDLIKLTIKYSINNKTYSFYTEHLISAFHSDSIEGLDVCVNKPYIITGSKDKYLIKMVQQKQMEDEIYSVAFHPSGMHALVSGVEKSNQ